MSKLLVCVIFFVLGPFRPAGALPPPGLESGLSRMRRDVHCKDEEDWNGNFCCLKCPAGTRLISACTTAGTRGTCEECDDGTFTEHTNTLKQCFKCTQCRSDQEIVRACSHTHDTECQCRSGRFCAPDQACEVCKKCLRCGPDEEVVRNCTSTTNTECKKIQHKPASVSERNVMVPLLAAVGVIVAIVVVIVVFVCRRLKGGDSRTNPSDRVKAGQRFSDDRPTGEGRSGEPSGPSRPSLTLFRPPVRAKSSVRREDECQVLCESLSSSASNSQHSLTGNPPYAFPAAPPRASPMVPWLPDRREDAPFLNLVAVNGEESLRRCFELFEDMDVAYLKRFFRHLGISDNVIKSKEHHLYEDQIHDLLNIWVEKEGRDASLNDLLKALLDLNQRRTAETIKERAVKLGHYRCEG